MRRALHDQFAGVITGCLPELLDGLRARLVELLGRAARRRHRTRWAGHRGPGSCRCRIEQAACRLGGPRRAAQAVQHSLRGGQRPSEASSVSAPGTTPLSVGHTWQHVFDAGLHEFSDPGQHGLPPAYLKQIPRLRGLSARPDVWLPSVDELRAAYRQRSAPPGAGVVHWDDEYLYPNDHEGSTAS